MKKYEIGNSYGTGPWSCGMIAACCFANRRARNEILINSGDSNGWILAFRFEAARGWQ
jgi:hypothetical protein